MLAGPQGGRMPRAGRARPGGKRTPKRGREMRRVPKLVLSALVALSVALGVAPATALADGVTDCSGGDSCTHVAAIENTHYNTLAEAVTEAQDGDTIVLLRTTEGSGVKVDGTSGRTLTIDLHGFTYTVIDPTVGSPNTETNAFQLLKGSTITFKDGTIRPGTDAAKILFQNYCNLTLDNVTVDCTGSKCQYVSSNNFGNTVIRNSTLIAAEGQAAFDVYYWPKKGYGDGVSVTVEGDSVITGRIEYGSDGSTTGKQDIAEKASLNIKGGTFTGSLTTSYLGDDGNASINITGGTFQKADGTGWDVSDYVQPGMKQDSNGNIVINADTAVAKIGEVGYATLQNAVNAAGDGDTITMLKAYDATSEDTITFNADKDVTLDLGKCELTLSRFNLVQGQLTVENGSVECTGQAFNVYAAPTADTAADYTKLVIADDVTINADYAVCLFPGSGNAGYSSAIEVYGNIASGGIFVSGNLGNDIDTAGKMVNSNKIPTVTIHEGAVVSNGSEGQGIAMNGLANVTVDGGTITGSEAIGVKRGTLTVNGGTFRSNGEYVNPTEANNNGTENTGATISITSTYNNAGTIKVNLNGGTFTSENAPAVYQGHSKSGDTTKTYMQGVTLDIQGGTFTSPDKVPTVFIAAEVEGDAADYTQQAVSGGTFSQDLSESAYLTDKVQYQVAHMAGTFSYAKSLKDALAAEQPGDEITKLNDESTVTLTLDYGYDDLKTTIEVEANTSVDLPEPTRSGYTFQGWYNESGRKVESSYTVASSATLNARWSLIPAPAPTTYDVTVAEIENGEVAVDKAAATAGERVTVTATPAEGHEVASVSVTCGEKQVDVTDNGDGTFTFVMPAGDVTVTVAFEASAPAVELPFTDVAEGDWYYGAVSFVYANGLMTGYEGTTLFGPEDALGREQAAAVLHRALGAGEHAGDCGLADVVQSDWYAQPVNWAVETGLIAGYGDGSGLFGVGDALTRDQFAAIIARVAGADLSKADPSALGAFSDGGEVAGWAVPAVSWAVQTGVLEGSDDGSGGMELRASAEITRGEMAAMIMRAAEAGLLPTA